MVVYLIRRLFLVVPTFIGITLLTFLLINMAPGGPVEQRLQQIRFGGGGEGSGSFGGTSRTSAVNEEIVQALKKQYGLDKPVLERYFIWLKNILRFDFGESFTYEEPAMDVIVSKFPVSMQFGIATLFLVYLISIPLGIQKAIKAGTPFDKGSNLILYSAYSIPALVLAIALIVIFAGRLDLFPVGGFKSDNYETLSLMGKILDRAHHFVLPLTCYVFGAFTQLTMITRNSMLDVIKSDYIRTARAKGLSEAKVNFKHALRNALIPVATGLSGFFGVFLAGSFIIENIFDLDGLGKLGYNSIFSRDFNVLMGQVYLSSLVLLMGKLFSDIVYVLVDPRIDFK